jgi:hypothetical protein
MSSSPVQSAEQTEAGSTSAKWSKPFYAVWERIPNTKAFNSRRDKSIELRRSEFAERLSNLPEASIPKSAISVHLVETIFVLPCSRIAFWSNEHDDWLTGTILAL